MQAAVFCDTDKALLVDLLILVAFKSSSDLLNAYFST